VPSCGAFIEEAKSSKSRKKLAAGAKAPSAKGRGAAKQGRASNGGSSRGTAARSAALADRWDPRSLPAGTPGLGSRLEIYWSEDAAWFAATVVAWERRGGGGGGGGGAAAAAAAATGEHELYYDDGTVEHLRLQAGAAGVARTLAGIEVRWRPLRHVGCSGGGGASAAIVSSGTGGGNGGGGGATAAAADDEWRVEGHAWLGRTIRRTTYAPDGVTAVGSADALVIGWLDVPEADFISPATGEPAALWRVRYVTGKVKGDVEDLEVADMLASTGIASAGAVPAGQWGGVAGMTAGSDGSAGGSAMVGAETGSTVAPTTAAAAAAAEAAANTPALNPPPAAPTADAITCTSTARFTARLLDTLHAVPLRVALGLLMHRLVCDPLATPFIVPVPRDVPYYHETVAEPMDLGTVQARLAAEHYTQPATGTAAVSLQAGPGAATTGSGKLKLKVDDEEVVVDIDGEVAPAWVMEARAHVGKILGAAPDLTALSTKQVRAQVQEAMPSVDLRKDKGNRALLKAMIKEQAAAAQEATASTAAASPPALGGAEAFAHDVRLVWGNCRQFNETGSALFNSATALSKVFEYMWEAFRRPPPSAAERAAAAKAERVAAAAERKRAEKTTKAKAAKIKTTKAEKGKAGGGKAGVLPMSATAAAAPATQPIALTEHQRELEAQGRWLVGRRLKVLFEDLRWHYGEVAAYEPHAMRLALRPYRIVWADNGGGSGGGGSLGSSGGIWHSIHVKSMDGKGHLDDSMLLELCEPPPQSFVPSLISPAQEAAMAEEAKVARAEKERGEAIAAHRAKLGRDTGVATRINIAKGGRNNAASKGGSIVANTTGDSLEPDGEKWNAHVPAPPPVSTEARASGRVDERHNDDGVFRSGCAELFGSAADNAVESPRTTVVTAALADTGAPMAPVFGASLGMPLMPLTPSAASLLLLDSPLVAASAENRQCSAASLASVSASAPVAMTAENIVEGLGCGASPLNDKGDASMPLLNGALGDVFAGLPAAAAGGDTPPPAPSAMERPTLSVPIGGCAAALESDGGGGGGSGGSGGGAESGAKKKQRVSREMMGLQDFNSSGKRDPFPSAVTPRSCAPLQTAPLVAAPLSFSPLASPSSSSNTEVARGQSSAACDEQPAKRAKSSSAAGCGLSLLHSSPLSNSNGVVQQVAADQSARTALPTKTVPPFSPSQPPTTPATWHGTLSFKKAACQLTLHGSSSAPPRTAEGFTVIGRVALSHLNFETLVVLTLENRTACTDMIQKLAISLVDKERAAACQMHGSAEQPQGPSLYLCPLSLLRALDDKGTGMPPHLRQIVRASPHQNDLVIGLWDAQRTPTPKKAVSQQKS
jgi:hypothetical protein